MIMGKFNKAVCLTRILNGDSFSMLFAEFKKSHVDKRLEQNLTFCFVHSDRQLHGVSFFTDNFYGLGLIFQLFAFVFDFGSHGQPGCDFGLFAIEDFEILVVRFLYPDAGGLGS